MTMIDEELLRRYLEEAADTVDPPENSFAEILSALKQEDHEKDPVDDPEVLEDDQLEDGQRDMWHPSRSHRLPGRGKQVLMGSAVAVILLVLLMGYFVTRPKPAHQVSSSTRMVHNSASLASPDKAYNYTIAAPSSGSSRSPAATSQPSTPSSPTVGSQGTYVEKVGSVDLTIKKGTLNQEISKLGSLAAGTGGFVASSQVSEDIPGEAPQANITLQVPVNSFESTVNQVVLLGKVTSMTTNGTDVTGQYVDLQARISALQASHQQYIVIMSKAQSISDILAVQAQLDNIDSQLEQLQQQLQSLQSQTSYSTLTVNLSETLPTVHHAPVVKRQNGFLRALDSAWRSFVGGVEGLISISGVLIFVLLILGIVAIGAKFAWRGIQRRRV